MNQENNNINQKSVFNKVDNGKKLIGLIISIVNITFCLALVIKYFAEAINGVFNCEPGACSGWFILAIPLVIIFLAFYIIPDCLSTLFSVLYYSVGKSKYLVLSVVSSIIGLGIMKGWLYVDIIGCIYIILKIIIILYNVFLWILYKNRINKERKELKMNQENNNIDQNNFNTTLSNGVPNNQSLQNSQNINNSYNNQMLASNNAQNASFGQNVSQMNNGQYNNIQNSMMSPNYSQNSSFNSINMEDELIKCYIGKNSDKLFKKVKNPNSINKNFNIFAFLFGPIYFMYRKMYLIGIIIWLLMAILFAFLPGIQLLACVVYGILFTKIYSFHINKKINKIKLENQNAPFDELKNICSKKGGVNFLVPIIISILFAILFIFSLVVFFFPQIIFWNQLANELGYRTDTNYVDGIWNCKSFGGNGEGEDFIVTMKLDEDMSFSWSKYNDELNNHVYGTYTFEDENKTNNNGEYRYFMVNLSSSEYVMDGEVQSKAYESKYEIGISKVNKDAILMNVNSYNMYHCYLED